MKYNYIVFLVMICVILVYHKPAIADDMPQYHTLTVLIVDRSDKLHHLQKLKNICDLLEKRAAANEDGERVVGIAVTGKAATMRKLVDTARCEEGFFTSRMKVRKDVAQIKNDFKALWHDLSNENESYDSSAILETLDYAVRIFQTDPMAADGKITHKQLVIYSDMLQNSDSISFYGPKGNKTLHEIDNTFSFMNKELLIPKLHGVQVYVAGVGGNISDSRGRLVEKFWRRLFKESGASVKNYAPLLLAY